MLVLIKEPPRFLAWFWILEVSVRLPRAVSCGHPAVLPGSNGRGSPWCSLLVSLSFYFFFFFLFCLLCLLPVRIPALEPESFMKSLALPEPFFPFLAQSYMGRFNCLKIKGLCWDVESCGHLAQRFNEGFWETQHWGLAGFGRVPGARRARSFFTGVCRAGEEPSASTAPWPWTPLAVHVAQNELSVPQG